MTDELFQALTLCREMAARLRGDWQLAGLFAARDNPRLTALLALKAELQDVLTGSAEQELAQSRLVWWQEELSNPQPQHPITRVLDAHGGRDTALLNNLLDAAAQELENSAPQNMGDWQRYCVHSGASFHLLVAGPEAGARDALATAGLAARMLQLLCELPDWVANQRFWLPADAALGAGVTLPSLRERPTSEAACDLIRDFAQSAGDKLTTDRAALRDMGRANAVVVALARRRLALLRKAGFDPWRLGRTQGPGAVFTAWRAARRQARS